MLVIDGSVGEGGGQIVRTSLALSLVTGQPFTIENIRAGREQSGLRRQHLTAVNAAAEIGRARVSGAAVGARSLSFFPGRVVPGEYKFTIGTAGSTTLVLQTVLPPLMIAATPSRLTFEGGTHNIKAPPYEFLAETFLPLINRMGPGIEASLERYGFYPPGGGRFHVAIHPSQNLRHLELRERGEIQSLRARALVVKLPKSVAEREIEVVRATLGWSEEQCEVEVAHNALSPGNVLTLRIVSDHVTEIITGMGQRGVRAEAVARSAVAETRRYIESRAPIGEHLADQLLIPMALAAGGSFVTGPLSLHTTTNIEVIRKFLDVEIAFRPIDSRKYEVTVSR